MRYYGVRVMPIVGYGRHGHLIGIVTRSDLLRRRAAMSAPRPPRHPPTGPLAEDVMTPVRQVEWVHESDPADLAANLLNHRTYTALPVVDDEGRLVGLVSEADLKWPSGVDWTGVRRKPDQRQVGDVMTTGVTTTSPGAHVRELARLMAPGRLRMLPVVDDHRRLVGVVSRTDLLHPLTLEVLEADLEADDDV
jgi:CBS domain-containing protein